VAADSAGDFADAAGAPGDPRWSVGDVTGEGQDGEEDGDKEMIWGTM
jgi:hypothetical protein